MKTIKTIKTGLIFVFLLTTALGFMACSSGGGGGGGGGNPAGTITGTMAPMVVVKSTDGFSCAVDTGAVISVTFSNDMLAASINTLSFTIGGVSGTVTYNSSTRTATFTPSSPLDYGTSYTATITTLVKDSAQNPMAGNYTWSFTTKQGSTVINPSHLMGGAMQGNPLNSATNIVTTFAGFAGMSGSTDGSSSSARFSFPDDVTTDGTNLFIADTANYTIRKIVISSGSVTTIAGSAGLPGSTNGTGSAAQFNSVRGITTDGSNLFVADIYSIRKIVIATGAVTTLAGSAGLPGSTDGTGLFARFNYPTGITTDGTNLFVVDTNNFTIRKIVIATGVVTTLAGSVGSSGPMDGTGSAARFNFKYSPSANNYSGITTDGTNLFVADTANYTIRKIVISTGAVTTLAGSAGSSGSNDGTGSTASFSFPTGITTDGTNLFVTDNNTGLIRKIVISSGAVTTIAGNPLMGSSDGAGTAAQFYFPSGIITDGKDLFVADTNNSTIRKISSMKTAPSVPTGVIATPGNGFATISWDTVPGAACYNLFCSGTEIASIANPYIYTGLTNGTPYSCSVTAVNSYGESAISSQISVTPTAAYTLRVIKSGACDGTVSSSPAGISCDSTCSASVAPGTQLTLTATPVSGATFTGWSGSCSGTGSCTVTMDANKTVAAAFACAPPPSAVSVTVTSSSCVQSWKSCDIMCSAQYTMSLAGTVCGPLNAYVNLGGGGTANCGSWQQDANTCQRLQASDPNCTSWSWQGLNTSGVAPGSTYTGDITVYDYNNNSDAASWSMTCPRCRCP